MGLDFRTALCYYLKGKDEFGTEWLAFIDVDTIKIGSEDWVLFDSWGDQFRYLDTLSEAPVLSFTIASDSAAPVSKPTTTLLLGSGLLGLAGVRKKFRRQ